MIWMRKRDWSHYQHFHSYTEWLKKHKQNENSLGFFEHCSPSLMPFLTAQIENMLCFLCSWPTRGTMTRCKAAVRDWAIAGSGVKGSRRSCRFSICFLSGIQSELYKRVLKVALLACFILNAVITHYPHSLHNTWPECQLCNNLHFLKCDTGILEVLLPLALWKYFTPIRMLIWSLVSEL